MNRCPKNVIRSRVVIETCFDDELQVASWAWIDLDERRFCSDFHRGNTQDGILAAVSSAVEAIYRPADLLLTDESVARRLQTAPKQASCGDDLFCSLRKALRDRGIRVRLVSKKALRAEKQAARQPERVAADALISGSTGGDVCFRRQSTVIHADASYDAEQQLAVVGLHDCRRNSTQAAQVDELVSNSYVAELHGILAAVEAAVADDATDHLVVMCDCLGAVCVARSSGARKADEAGAVRDAIQRASNQLKSFQVRWVRGHAGVSANRAADLAARSELRRAVA